MTPPGPKLSFGPGGVITEQPEKKFRLFAITSLYVILLRLELKFL
jgi:hypothetical protein